MSLTRTFCCASLAGVFIATAAPASTVGFAGYANLSNIARLTAGTPLTLDGAVLRRRAPVRDPLGFKMALLDGLFDVVPGAFEATLQQPSVSNPQTRGGPVGGFSASSPAQLASGFSGFSGFSGASVPLNPQLRPQAAAAEPAKVPLPASAFLLLAALGGLALSRTRRAG